MPASAPGPSSANAPTPRAQVLRLLGAVELAPLLVAPGVVGDLVPAAADLPQRLRVELGVEALDEEGGRADSCVARARQQLAGPGDAPWASLEARRAERAELELGRLAEVVEAEAERAVGAAGPAHRALTPRAAPGSSARGRGFACSRAQRKWCRAEASRIGKLSSAGDGEARASRGAVSVSRLSALAIPQAQRTEL